MTETYEQKKQKEVELLEMYNYWYKQVATGNCKTCHGKGKTYLGDLDPVEGYKMADSVKCLKCEGTGKSNDKIDLEDFFEWRDKKICREALKKLTDEERRAVEKYFSNKSV